MSVAKNALKKTAEKIALRPPRAVSATEAPTIRPHRESTKSTMMPWNQWFQRFIQDSFGEERYQKFRKFMFFDADVPYETGPIYPAVKVPISKDDPTKFAMYRTPSPGSQPPVKLPTFDKDEDPYDSGYFKRDTRRRYLSSELGDPDLEKRKLAFLDQNDPAVKEELEKLEAGPESSPGNKGVFATGPSSFDPTGLRATMSVTWASMNKSLDAHMPNHLPTPVWMERAEEVKKSYESKGIPVPVGEYYSALKVPRERRVASW
uniref:Uncharacterized protein n=1 Tax=Amphora coffeiformis TaxID=265554 RepID=A0A7S3P9X4_9STRA|mmetsp:Transcript_17752/g.35691  ORF Transcript_17752/g.35691 Transcript_17752/m.35691 type:complete len:262 (-) Transcript_17752:96-881(-)